MRNTRPDTRHKIQSGRVFSATKCAIYEIGGGVEGTNGGGFREQTGGSSRNIRGGVQGTPILQNPCSNGTFSRGEKFKTYQDLPRLTNGRILCRLTRQMRKPIKRNYRSAQNRA